MDLALCKTITTQGPCKRESTEALRCKKDAKHSRKAIWTATSLPFCLSFRTDPYSRTRFSCLIQRYTKLVQICTDVNIWTNSMCWYPVSFSMILIPHLFGLGQLVQVDPSKARVGEDPMRTAGIVYTWQRQKQTVSTTEALRNFWSCLVWTSSSS